MADRLYCAQDDKLYEWRKGAWVIVARIIHKSDCAMHNEPAYPAGPCDCGAITKALEKVIKHYEG